MCTLSQGMADKHQQNAHIVQRVEDTHDGQNANIVQSVAVKHEFLK
jgi:hypothetical protein